MFVDPQHLLVLSNDLNRVVMRLVLDIHFFMNVVVHGEGG